VSEFLDISVPIDGDLPVWPGSPGAQVTVRARISDGSDANVSEIRLELHTGTHIDAPLHFVDDGADVEATGIDALVGPAIVAEVLGEGAIDRDAMASLAIPEGTSRLLLRTSNSLRGLMRSPEFRTDAAALTADAAAWVVEQGIGLIGIDYLSIQQPSDGPETHQALLRAGVVILEGVDLRAVTPGPYDLVCLPVRLTGTEAAPARAILLPSGTL
jgi:arylformamidase